MEDGDIISLRSTDWPKALLRIDGNNINESTPSGSGIVNCQYYDLSEDGEDWRNNILAYEKIIVHKLDSDSELYSFESNRWKNCYLRLTGVNGKALNLQYHSTIPPNSNGCWEIFEKINSPDGGFYLRSYHSPDFKLKFVANSVTSFNGSGSGSIIASNSKQETEPGTLLNHLLLTPAVNETIITFTNLGSEKYESYTENEFVLSTNGLFQKFGPYIGNFADVIGIVKSTASTTQISINRENGQTFSFNSILARQNNASSNQLQIDFTGQKYFGGTVTHRINLTDNNYSEFYFPDTFNNLTKLTWNISNAAFARINLGN